MNKNPLLDPTREIDDGVTGPEAYRAWQERQAEQERNRQSQPEQETQPEQQAPDLDEFIYVPSINLYVAKEKTLHGTNWEQAHKELHKQNMQMLTIRQFVDFILYLKQNPTPEYNAVLEEITAVRDPWKAEWLDAKFEEKNSVLQINYNHRTVGGNLQPQNQEKLEDCLMQNKTPGIDLDYWLNNATSQGFPPIDTREGSLYYWHPIADFVAWFYAGSVRAVLSCYRYPPGSYPSLGVRAARAP